MKFREVFTMAVLAALMVLAFVYVLASQGC